MTPWASAVCLLAALACSAAAPRPGALPQVDVSQAELPQAEVRVAADPTDPDVLLAASNSEGEGAMRVYSSTDGGLAWDSTPVPQPPASGRASCFSDPAVAIDRQGREYVVFMQSDESCDEGGGGNVTLRLATRARPGAPWSVAERPIVAPDGAGSFDDNPWLTVDANPGSPHLNRLYLAWFRSVAGRRLGLQLSFSDDGGAHWSAPIVVSDRVGEAGYPSVAVAANGTVYVAWHDFARRELLVDRSVDGGLTFGRDRSTTVRARDARTCPNGRPIPAQRIRCIRADPTILVDRSPGKFRGRVYLTYSERGPDGSEDVRVAAFDARLRPVRGTRARIRARGRHPARGHQFWPTSATDDETGEVWLCFYDTRGNGIGPRAWFSCAVSEPGGGGWTAPVRVATVPSDEAQQGAAEFAYGDYEGLAVAAGVAHPLWTDSRDLASRAEEIYATRITAAVLRRLAGRPRPRVEANVDVSRAPGSQNEPAVAVDPRNPRILVAGSNSTGTPMQAYGSVDGGRTWSASPLPPDRPPPRCVGDPAVAVAASGRQYFAYVRDSPCDPTPPTTTGVYVAARAGPGETWSAPDGPVGGTPAAGDVNDKPAIAVDVSPTSPFRDRVYVAWSRGTGQETDEIVLAHSDDGGRTWSVPLRVNDTPADSGYASVATGPDGRVYVAWHAFAEDRLLLDVSGDGGDRFGVDRIVDVKNGRSTCPASWSIPAQARRCVRPNPVVTVDGSLGPSRGEVYVTYGNRGANGTQDVFVAAFDARLTAILGAPAGEPARIGPADGSRRSDQFWPASTVDTQTGTLWACFYDTRGDPARRRTRYSCTRSDDGGRTWSPPAAAASRASDETRRGATALQYGDYAGLAAAAGVAHPVWTDTRRARTLGDDVYTARIR